MTVTDNDSSLAGFLNRALDIGAGFIRKDKPAAPVVKTPPPFNWRPVIIGTAVVLAVALVFKLITKK